MENFEQIEAREQLDRAFREWEEGIRKIHEVVGLDKKFIIVFLDDAERGSFSWASKGFTLNDALRAGMHICHGMECKTEENIL